MIIFITCLLLLIAYAHLLRSFRLSTSWRVIFPDDNRTKRLNFYDARTYQATFGGLIQYDPE